MVISAELVIFTWQDWGSVALIAVSAVSILNCARVGRVESSFLR